MRISDWSSDVCSSDLKAVLGRGQIGMGAEPDLAPAGGGGKTLGLDGKQRMFLGAGAEGMHLDNFAYQFAPHTSSCEKEIGRAPVRTPVTNAHPVCRLLLEKKKL